MTIAYQAFTVAFSGKYLFNHTGENGISYNPFWISKTYTTVEWYYIPFDGLIFNTVCYYTFYNKCWNNLSKLHVFTHLLSNKLPSQPY